MHEPDFEDMFSRIRVRYATIIKNSSRMESFLLHLRSLGEWEEGRKENPEETAEFPQDIWIAYAVCYPDCGRMEFIVEGSTQECQRCGRLMFRTETQLYERKR
jgi:hypothetical protein